MLHQDVAIHSRMQQLVAAQWVTVTDVVNGAVDLAIQFREGGSLTRGRKRRRA